MTKNNYREQAERCLQLASECQDREVADMLRAVATDYLEMVVKNESPAVPVPRVVQHVHQTHQMQQSQAKDGEPDKD
jgi:DUF438 domain-containing protein